MDTSYGAVTVDRGVNNQKWDILGQTYVPLHVTESSFSIHTTFPPESFVPPHIHETQDEFIFVIEGTMELELDGKTIKAGPGTQVTLPMKVPHALYNRSGSPVKALVVVSPTRKMYDYMKKIDGMADTGEIARLGAEHEVPFV